MWYTQVYEVQTEYIIFFIKSSAKFIDVICFTYWWSYTYTCIYVLFLCCLNLLILGGNQILTSLDLTNWMINFGFVRIFTSICSLEILYVDFPMPLDDVGAKLQAWNISFPFLWIVRRVISRTVRVINESGTELLRGFHCMANAFEVEIVVVVEQDSGERAIDHVQVVWLSTPGRIGRLTII